MPLPPTWTDRIFARMLVRYGSAWLRLWEGLDLNVVKADWAEVLSGASAESLQYGLENLPADKPPATAAAFAAICKRRPDRPSAAITFAGSKPRPEVVAKLNAAAAALRNKRGTTEWAYASRGHESVAQRQMRRDAQRGVVMEHSAIGPFVAPPAESLPPGMRGEA